MPLGKASFEPAALEQNFRAVIDEIQRAKPASAKGRYLKKITVSSTMGPGVHVDTGRLKPEREEARPRRSFTVHILPVARQRPLVPAVSIGRG